MALKITSIAALAQGCATFVPTQGSTRAHSSIVQQPRADGQPYVAQDVVVAEATTTGAGVGMTAAAVAVLGLAAVGKTTRRTNTRIVCNSGGYGITVSPGICEPFAYKWDPLNLGSTEAKMERYETVEIKHGRIAMIATLGYLFPVIFRFPGCENFKNGLGAFDSIPPEGWAQLIAFIGAHEVFVRPRAGGMGGYDLGLGTELIEGIDPMELERRQTVERNNGRLAMWGIMGLMIQDGLFGVDPVTYMRTEGWWGAPVNFLVQDIPMCRGGCALPREKRGAGLTAMRAVVYDDPFASLYQKEDRRSRAIPWLQHPEQLDGWVGGEAGFDPLNVTMALPVYLVREAELKHARVCMLATIGWIATDLGARFPADIFQKATSISAHDDMVAAGMMQPFLATVGCVELYSAWLLLEGQRNHLVEGGVQRDSGDFFLGKKFLPSDPDQANSMKLKELANGRLAMLSFSGIVTQAVLTNSTFPFF